MKKSKKPLDLTRGRKFKVPKPIQEMGKHAQTIGESSIGIGKEIGKGIYEIGKVGVKTTAEVGKGAYKISEIGVNTSIAVGKHVYKAGKASVNTGIAATKGLSSVVFYPVKKRRSILDFFWKSKRGIIAGAADNDPAGIVTYTQTGAIAGYNLLWLVPLSLPLLVAVEEMSARIGIVTKKGINQIIIENFGLFWAWFTTIIIVICNTLTIGADIAAMADVTNILTGIPSVVFALLFGALFLFVLYKKGYAVISRWLFILTPVFLAYIVSAFLFDVPWGQALRDTFIPRLSVINIDLAMVALGFLGTTITPFLVFWETTQEIEERKDLSHLGRERIGVTTGMFFTQFVTFFIVVAAAVAFSGGGHLITTARDAAVALKPLGVVSFLLFSLGILGSGLIAIPVLASSTGYTFAETMQWSRGLNKSFPKAKGFYMIIFLSIIIGVIISLSGFNAILMLLYSQVLNGILMPILLVFLLLITNNKKIMGTNKNKFWSNFFGIFAVAINILFITIMVWGWIK